MQTIELKIEDNYMDSVMNILKSLKDDMIKEIHIKNSKSMNGDLEEFNGLIRKSKNGIMLTKKSAINTDEMIDDILRYQSLSLCFFVQCR
jgi:hypothetical protein